MTPESSIWNWAKTPILEIKDKSKKFYMKMLFKVFGIEKWKSF